MPRLLSNKSPKKNLPVKVEKKKSPVKVEKEKSLRPEESMSAWEYYNFLMWFGRRKMTRSEWLVWRLKKDTEDMEKGGIRKEFPLKKRKSSAEYNWRIKKDLDFIDFIAEEEFSLDFKKSGD